MCVTAIQVAGPCVPVTDTARLSRDSEHPNKHCETRGGAVAAPSPCRLAFCCRPPPRRGCPASHASAPIPSSPALISSCNATNTNESICRTPARRQKVRPQAPIMFLPIIVTLQRISHPCAPTSTRWQPCLHMMPERTQSEVRPATARKSLAVCVAGVFSRFQKDAPLWHLQKERYERCCSFPF